jgi:hypothetical protein
MTCLGVQKSKLSNMAGVIPKVGPSFVTAPSFWVAWCPGRRLEPIGCVLLSRCWKTGNQLELMAIDELKNQGSYHCGQGSSDDVQGMELSLACTYGQ